MWHTEHADGGMIGQSAMRPCPLCVKEDVEGLGLSYAWTKDCHTESAALHFILGYTRCILEE